MGVTVEKRWPFYGGEGEDGVAEGTGAGVGMDLGWNGVMGVALGVGRVEAGYRVP